MRSLRKEEGGKKGERIQMANLDDRFLNREATIYVVHRCLALKKTWQSQKEREKGKERDKSEGVWGLLDRPCSEWERPECPSAEEFVLQGAARPSWNKGPTDKFFCSFICPFSKKKRHLGTDNFIP